MMWVGPDKHRISTSAESEHFLSHLMRDGIEYRNEASHVLEGEDGVQHLALSTVLATMCREKSGA